MNTENKDPVRLILYGVDIHSSTSSPVHVMSAKETIIILADNTENYITDRMAQLLRDQMGKTRARL